MTDNTTAVACVNKQGSTKSKTCNAITRQIWDFAMDRELWLSAAHCPGVQNVEADEASRLFNDQTEWTLRHDIFDTISQFVNVLGGPSIDLFASRLNHKVERYCAWLPDPGAIFVDSFMYDWHQEDFVYAFPPFSIIHLVLQKWIQDEAEGILIVLFWPTQPWSTLMSQIICERPITFDVVNDILFLPFSEKGAKGRSQHPLAENLMLMAAVCNGSRSSNRASRQPLSTPCCVRDGTALKDCIKHIWRDGKNIVTRRAQVTSHHLSLRR